MDKAGSPAILVSPGVITATVHPTVVLLLLLLPSRLGFLLHLNLNNAGAAHFSCGLRLNFLFALENLEILPGDNIEWGCALWGTNGRDIAVTVISVELIVISGNLQARPFWKGFSSVTVCSL